VGSILRGTKEFRKRPRMENDEGKKKRGRRWREEDMDGGSGAVAAEQLQLETGVSRSSSLPFVDWLDEVEWIG
jgi:hypothetical protein